MSPLSESVKAALQSDVVEKSASRERRELRGQLRGLLLLALAAIAFAILRAALHRVFAASWWRLW